MRTIGIIAEYNPLHGGHRYQIEETRRRFQAEFVAVAMSGDFVQRGEPAIFDKYARTKAALSAGVDLVVELPVCFATSSAEDFAAAGVALLDRLGVVDGLCFGSEAGDVTSLRTAAELLVREPEEYKNRLRECLKSGASFPKAREEALLACLNSSNDLLSTPNNILGVEYIKALLRRGSRIEPLTIRRKGQGYHELVLPADATAYPSASALRQAIRDRYTGRTSCIGQTGCTGQADVTATGALVPGFENFTPVFPDDLSSILNWRLLELTDSGQDLSAYADISPELAARLRRHALDFASFTGRIEQLKTRQYTYTRISRGLLHLLLGITDGDIALAKGLDYAPYVRILGFRKAALPLLSDIKKRCPLPLITKTADAGRRLDGDALRLFHLDLHASHLRQSIVYAKSGQRLPNEYTQSVIIWQG